MLGGTLQRLGALVLEQLADAGRMWWLAVAATRRAVIGPFQGRPVRLRATIEQTIRVGNKSLSLVALIAALMGIILALQSAYQLRQLGATHLVAGLVAVSVTRELGPLMTAILVAGRAGSAIAAELGTMKVSEEIDALEVIGLDPVDYLVLPRVLALLVALPCLTIFADLIGILGGCLAAVGVLGLSGAAYLADTGAVLVLEDLWGGVFKALAFGGIIGLVACEQGLSTRGGAEAVGSSTTTTVVRSIVLIIAADLFVTALLFARK
jgi:phospholipid/cholesterol/gamma-HCH transport system permease protein